MAQISNRLLELATSWWAWCAYLAIIIVIAQSSSLWWVRWPLFVVGVLLYVGFAAVQMIKLLGSGIPLYFGTVSTIGQRERVLKDAIAAYLMTVFEFAIFYLLISLSDDKAFNIGTLDLGSAFYFSAITMATVGYGDIVPVDRWLRLLVCGQVFIGLGFTVLLFAMLSNLKFDPPDSKVAK